MSYQSLLLGLGTAVTRTFSSNNRLQAETANIRAGQPIRFIAEGNNVLFGGVVPNTVYFVLEVIDSENFTISQQLNGSIFELQDGEGFMLVQSVRKESLAESLRKVDTMFKEIYTTGFSEDNVGILSVQEDTNPALGGNLNLNSKDITGAGDINISGTINATVISGNLRGVLAGGLSGPVDGNGTRIGNPTIDGLPFELGNPQPSQVISWDGPNEKFVLASLAAVSVDNISLDDVLFNGNTSSNSISVNSVTTNTLTVNNGIDYSSIINAPLVPADVSDLTDTTGIIPEPQVQSDWTAVSGLGAILNKPTLATVATSGSYDDLTNKPILFSGNYNDLTNKPPVPETLLDLGITDGTVGQVLTTNGAGGFTFTTVSSGGTGLGSRTTVSGTTGALAINAVGNLSITGFKTYALLGIGVEIPAWVRLYSSAAARTADASRLETEDPQPGAGIIAEVITTTNNQVILFTPATIGFNSENPVSNTIYASVKNKGTGVATIQINLTIVQLEA